MRVALDEAWRCIPERERTRHLHCDMAARLLRAAGEGERDPKKLKEVALGPTLKVDALDFLAGLAKQVTAEVIGDEALQREGKQQAKRSADNHGSVALPKSHGKSSAI